MKNKDNIEIPMRVQLLLGYSDRDYADLQEIKKQSPPPSQIEKYRNRLRETNRRLWVVADEIILPRYLYLPQ